MLVPTLLAINFQLRVCGPRNAALSISQRVVMKKVSPPPSRLLWHADEEKDEDEM